MRKQGWGAPVFRMKRLPLSSLCALTVLFGVVAGSIVACSSGVEPVSDAAPAKPQASEPEDVPPSPPPTATPVTPTAKTGGDASAPPADDCKRAAPSKVCGVAPQCGCAQTHTCDVVDAKGSVDCITAGNAPMGHPCTATAGCALGLTCVFGTCHAFCDEAKTCSQNGTGTCVQVKAPGGVSVPNFAVCRVACELHDPMSCYGKTNAGVGVCFVDGQGATDCQAGGTRSVNQTCTAPDDCGPGLVCATTSSSTTCRRWCRVGENDCGAGKTCTGLKTEVKVGEVVYGTCP